MTRRLALAIVLGWALLAVPAAADATTLPAGRLFALGCTKDAGDPGTCEIALTPGINSGEALATSRDGKYVWAGGANGVLWTFRRGPAGRLSRVGCQDDGNSCPGPAIAHLLSVDGLATSPDGRDLYAIDTGSIGSGTLHVLHVRADGRLTDGGCFDVSNVCGAANMRPGMANATDVTVSGDGKNVYVTSGFGTDLVADFDRTPGGPLDYAGCTGKSSICGPLNTAPGLEGASGVAVSPSGKFVYVASTGPMFGGTADGTVAWLTRNADGSLDAGGCVEQTGAASPCTVSGPGLVDPFDLAVTTGHVYVVSRDGVTDGSHSTIVTLPRASNGSLSYGSCFAWTGSAQCGAGRAIPGIRGAFDIVVAPDGKTIHTTALGGFNSKDGAVGSFVRAADGTLTPARCYGQSDSSETGCTRTRTIQDGGQAIGASPDSANVYAGTTGGVAWFGREVGPTCRDASVTVPGTTASLPVPCFDLNADALTHSAVAGPAHGDLGDFDDAAGTVGYVPEPGYVGADFLTYRASDGSLGSGVGRVDINVTNVRPRVRRLRLTRKRFRRGRKLVRLTRKRKAKVGTSIRFRLSEPAKTTLSFERVLAGRKVGRRCRAPRRGLRSHKRCKRYRKVRTKVRVNGDTGGNSVRFQGRLSRRKRLRAGHYRLTVVGKDKQGLRSTRRRVRFTLLR